MRTYSDIIDGMSPEERARVDAALEAWFNNDVPPPATPEPIYPDEWRGHWIYLIASPADLIKVGISRNPDARLASIQSGHHDNLRLLATVAGLAEDEGSLHCKLASYRVRGEWFRLGPWLEVFMEGARAGENAGMIMKRLEAVQP